MTCRNCKHYSPLLGYCFGPTEAVYHTTSGNEACSAYEDGWKDEDPAYGEAIRWLLAVRNSSLRKRACRIVGDRRLLERFVDRIYYHLEENEDDEDYLFQNATEDALREI